GPGLKLFACPGRHYLQHDPAARPREEDSMNRYWLRIGLGALAVFAVGYAGWRLVERGVGEVRDLAMSDQEISIPLFGALPFTVEGRRVGSLQRLTLLRDAPKQISGVIVRVSG